MFTIGLAIGHPAHRLFSSRKRSTTTSFVTLGQPLIHNSYKMGKPCWRMACSETRSFKLFRPTKSALCSPGAEESSRERSADEGSSFRSSSGETTIGSISKRQTNRPIGFSVRSDCCMMYSRTNGSSRRRRFGPNSTTDLRFIVPILPSVRYSRDLAPNYLTTGSSPWSKEMAPASCRVRLVYVVQLNQSSEVFIRRIVARSREPRGRWKGRAGGRK